MFDDVRCVRARKTVAERFKKQKPSIVLARWKSMCAVKPLESAKTVKTMKFEVLRICFLEVFIIVLDARKCRLESDANPMLEALWLQ